MIRQNIKNILGVILLSFASVTVADDIVIPDMGTAGVRGMTVQAEKNYGEYFMRKANGAGIVARDPVMTEYISTVGGKLIRAAENVYFPYEFFLSADTTLNASAFLGGKVQVNAGLFHYTKTEDEFASVLAHEISHITQRHIARMIENQSEKQAINISSLIGSLVLAIINPTVGAAALSSTTGLMIQSNINYTRDNEYEADRIGINVLYNAGFNPLAMADLFRKMLSMQGNINSAFTLLIDHPLSEIRVAEAYNRAKNLPKRNDSKNPNYMLAKARVDVRYMGLDLKNLKQRLLDSKTVNPVYKKYALALIELDTGNFNAASEWIEKMPELAHNDFILDALTDIDLGQGNIDRAISRLEKYYQERPEDEVIVLNLANACIEGKRPDKCIPVLKKFLRKYPKHVLATELLVKAFMQKKDRCKGFQTSAWEMVLKGNFSKANMYLTDALHICPGSEREIIRAQFKKFNDIRTFDESFEKKK
ncbi:MAG: M48 family metalloprotease [Succinivibrio sp.]